MLTKVNTYGLVYHWRGSNALLKPLLLTAHQGLHFLLLDLPLTLLILL